MSTDKPDIKPAHVAFIMDGNGRWATKRHMPRTYGHSAGVSALKKVISRLRELNIGYATFYAFSTENWNRPKEEVDQLMKIFDEQFDELTKYEKENVSLRFIGDRSRLSESLQRKMSDAEQRSSGKDHDGLTVTIAINYGSRDEIEKKKKKLFELKSDGMICDEDVSPDLIDSCLDTSGMPAVDLLIRTGGELRLSNFLLWQCAYAELYFCDTLWPDFGAKELDKALLSFAKRDRRFGKVKNKG